MPGHPTTCMVEQGPAVLAAGVGWVGCSFFGYFFLSVSSILSSFLSVSSILSSFSNALSLGRWLDILNYCGLGCYYPTVVVNYYRRRARKVLVNRLVGQSLPRNSVNG